MKLEILIFYFFSFCTRIYAQDYVKNDIEHSFGYVSPELDMRSNTMIPSKYIVMLNVSDNERKYYASLSRTGWLKLLKQSDSDYGTNLVLYFFTEKDAILILDKHREAWLRTSKNDDLDYWSNYLKCNIRELKNAIDVVR